MVHLPGHPGTLEQSKKLGTKLCQKGITFLPTILKSFAGRRACRIPTQ
jgi:hypothetical protein